MAAKSISVGRSSDDVIRLLTGASGGNTDVRPLQNGLRVSLALHGAAVSLNVYPGKSGGCKVVFDRPESPAADEIAGILGGVAAAPGGKAKVTYAIEPVVEDGAWVGSDESGKGDYFGPLVTAAVALSREQWPVLQELGVRDSKALTDARATALAGQIAEAFPSKIVTIMPERYNALIVEMRTVNRVLAWAHARAIEDVLEHAPEATAAVADQFGDESLIERALMQRGRTVRLVQMPRAERDPAVAAASIIARAEFVRRLRGLGRQAGMELPKGAGSGTDAAARAYVSMHGREALGRVAKLHFKNTQRVLA